MRKQRLIELVKVRKIFYYSVFPIRVSEVRVSEVCAYSRISGLGQMQNMRKAWITVLEEKPAFDANGF